jgi:hypothetical protein
VEVSVVVVAVDVDLVYHSYLRVVFTHK